MFGFLLTATYRMIDGKPEVHLYGVLESGEPCLLIDDRVEPYFFVPAQYAAAVTQWVPSVQTQPTELCDGRGVPVVRVTARDPGELPSVRRRLEARNLVCYEADVRFTSRYLIDRGIRGSFEVHGHAEHQGRLGLVLRNPTLTPARWIPKLKVLSIDIETDLQGRDVFAIALHTHDFERVLLVHDHVLRHGEPVHSEKALIRRFVEYVHEIDPDVITGWNVVDFDLAVLLQAAHRHGLSFTLGRNDDELIVRKDPSFTRESRAILCGRQVLDGLALMRSSFVRLDDYKLETAAQTFLGKGKLLKGEGRHVEIQNLYRNAPQALVDYNLQDARLVTEILDVTGLIPLAVERSLLTGMQLDRVGASIASIDSLYLHELRGRGRVAPSVKEKALPEGGALLGGYVLDSKPGLFRNILVFDFKSLYPSIIRTFNIDPLTLLDRSHPGHEAIRAPNGAAFRRDIAGVLPDLLARLAAERERAKAGGDKIKANAIKILMNSFYGVLGATTSRLFSPAVANAVTSFGQMLIQWAMSVARERGYTVLYGDTDSLFVDAGAADAASALRIAEELRLAIGEEVAGRIAREYERESQLELEFEKLYLRFFMPELRGGKGGSKKRYAGLVALPDGGEEMEFVGLEAVRRDWSPVSKRLQRDLLDRVFHDQPVEAYVREFVEALRAGRYDDELTYKKALRKDTRAYTKTTPPHVKAARKSGQASGIVAYVMTTAGPEPADQRTAPPDYEHYIEHQIAPVADAILRMRGTSFVSIVPSKGQLELF